LGIRLRHNFFDSILRNEESVDYVLEHFADANFDPEFYSLHHKEILEQYNQEQGTKLRLKKKSWKRIFKIQN
jgi:hypothetical protein